MSRRLRIPLALVVAVVTAVSATTARVAPLRPAIHAHAELAPASLRLGERASYRGWVLVPHAQTVRWVRPSSDGAFAWAAPRITRVAGAGGLDTARFEAAVQVFALGRMSLPGVSLSLAGGAPGARLPNLAIEVRPVIAASDTAASLKPLRGPLAAPWWERVDWWIVAAVLLAALAGILLIRWLRRPRRAVAAAPARVAPVRDPWAEAGAELAALRQLRLPEQGRYGEHALRLTRILRRLLERTTGTVAPGLTSSELLERLRSAAAGVDVARLETWLRIWDGIKFARQISTPDEASRAEQAVEAMARRPAQASSREVA